MSADLLEDDLKAPAALPMPGPADPPTQLLLNQGGGGGGGGGGSSSNVRWEQLHLLKKIYEEGFITKQEFEARKQQLVDELTGTDSLSVTNSSISSNNSSSSSSFPLSFISDSFIRDDFRAAAAAQQGRSPRIGASPYRAERISDLDNPYPPRIQKLKNHKSQTKRRLERNDVVPDPGLRIVPHDPPDWDKIVPEKAVKYSISVEEKGWIRKKCKVKIDDVPFARGGLRVVYHLWDCEEKMNMVAKVSLNAKDFADKKIYATDVQLQACAKSYAEKFNSYDPPKKVDFLIPFLLELLERPGKPICSVEQYISGPYRKHNGNLGYVSDSERNTPQAFSHFTYEASSHSLLICDIQGVDDLYTDPQIHTIGRKRLGKGDWGAVGIEKFLETHHCNAICKYLKLPSINPEYDAGETKAPIPEMPHPEIHRESDRNLSNLEETSSLLHQMEARPRRNLSNLNRPSVRFYFGITRSEFNPGNM